MPIGYKGTDRIWAFRLMCLLVDSAKILELRKEATRRADEISTEGLAPSDR